MRLGIAPLLGACLVITASAAWAQVPGQGPPGLPGAPPEGAQPITPPPSLQPFSPPVPAQPPVMLPPVTPQAPAPPAEAPRLDLRGRVGFGLGIWGAPVALAQAAAGAAGGLGAGVGGALSIRAWATDRLVLVPSLSLGIGYTSLPTSGTGSVSGIELSGYANGSIAPALSLGFAAYRGKSTRFIVSAGASFGYSSQGVLRTLYANGVENLEYQRVRTLRFSVPFGLTLEQFFTPKISIAIGAESPVFAYTSTRIGSLEPTTTISADFQSTRLMASVFFYTD